MIPNAQQTAEVQSTMTGERGKFSVHKHAHEKIMGVLTNLYEDPEGAVVREYLTNALDAQIEAQSADPSYVWRPIEVTTPSHFNKTYSIRDFGPGMDSRDMKNVYSQYGYSTKEHTNDQTGMLGLGSKCGLTYTGQFTVVGYKGGVRTRALITLDENEVPEYVILDTSTTSEPNGVEIQIPVRDRNSFDQKTKDFLRWWKPGQVLVDGAEPEYHGYDEVKPGVHLIEKSNAGFSYGAPTSYVIMGNVPYAVDDEYVPADLRDSRLGFAAYVPMGTVDFPPSRERLRYNARTKAAVAEIGNDLFEYILDKKLTDIVNKATHKGAYRAWADLTGRFASHPKAQQLTYKGTLFVKRFTHDFTTLDWDYQGRGHLSERSQVNLPSAMGREYGNLSVGVVVTGVDGKVTSYFKKKVRHYLRESSLNEVAYLVDKDFDSKWLEWVPRITADDVKAIKLPKSTGTATRNEPVYDVYSFDANSKVGLDLETTVTVPAGKTLTYVSPVSIRDTYRKSGCDPDALLTRLGEDYILVVLAKNRFEKFLRSYPNAVHVGKAIQDRINALVAQSTNAEFITGQLGFGENKFLSSVDPSLLKDKELADVAKVVQGGTNTTHYEQASRLRDYARRADVSAILPDQKGSYTNPCKKYPLIDRAGGRERDHMVIYCNAVYEANNGK